MSAMAFYRIANKMYRIGIPVLPYVLYRLIYLVNHCHIHYATVIGGGTRIAYGGISVVIHKKARIGRNCYIGPCVTIGGRSNDPRLPVIGDNVVIGTGAAILGDIAIGNNVVVGANAVVVTDIPANSIAAGIPAKVIKQGIDIRDYYPLQGVDLS